MYSFENALLLIVEDVMVVLELTELSTELQIRNTLMNMISR